jgi:hypothetical protein
MESKSQSERLAQLVRLDQVDSLQLLSAKTGVPAEKLAERWQSSSRGDAHRASGKRLKKLAPPKGTVPYSTGS